MNVIKFTGKVLKNDVIFLTLNNGEFKWRNKKNSEKLSRLNVKLLNLQHDPNKAAGSIFHIPSCVEAGENLGYDAEVLVQFNKNTDEKDVVKIDGTETVIEY